MQGGAGAYRPRSRRTGRLMPGADGYGILSAMKHDTKAATDERPPFAGRSDTDAERVATSLAAHNSPNTTRAYRGAWKRWWEWARRHGHQALPAVAAVVAAYIIERAKAGASPATVRMDCAGIAAAHRFIGADDPTACEEVRQALSTIARTNSGKGRGQVKGVDWASADHAAELAEADGSVTGLRDGVLIRLGSDALLRISELEALTVDDLEVQPDGSGTITIRRSKTDQAGRGQVRYVGAPTVAAIRRYQLAAGVAGGWLLRSVDRNGAVGGALGVRSIRRIITRRAARAGVRGRVSGHSLRVGSAQSLVAAGATLAQLQQAGDWRSARMASHYARHQLAAQGAVARLRYGVEAPAGMAPAPSAPCAACRCCRARVRGVDTRFTACLSNRRDRRRRSKRHRAASAVMRR